MPHFAIAAACLVGCTMTYVHIGDRGCRPSSALPVVDAIGAAAATTAAIALATTCEDTPGDMHACSTAYIGAGFMTALALTSALSAVWGAELPACASPADTAKARELAVEARAAAAAQRCGSALLLVANIAALDASVADEVRADPAIVVCAHD